MPKLYVYKVVTLIVSLANMRSVVLVHVYINYIVGSNIYATVGSGVANDFVHVLDK